MILLHRSGAAWRGSTAPAWSAPPSPSSAGNMTEPKADGEDSSSISKASHITQFLDSDESKEKDQSYQRKRPKAAAEVKKKKPKCVGEKAGLAEKPLRLSAAKASSASAATGSEEISRAKADQDAKQSTQTTPNPWTGYAQRGIIVTEKLLHFPRKGPDNGSLVLKTVAPRELLQAAECARKLQTLLYDIFLLPASGDLVLELMGQGKKHAQEVKLHKHSLGATPIFAFGTLLLLAADKIKDNPNNYSTWAKYKASDLHSRGVLNKLCQVAKLHDTASRKLALTFMFEHEVKQLQPLALAEIKKMEGCPWTVALQTLKGGIEQSALGLLRGHRECSQPPSVPAL